MKDVDTKQSFNDKRFALIDYEASEWLWRLEELLNNIYHLYKKSEIITGLQTNIKTKINIKKNDVGTNVRMQTRIHSERHLNDACKILKANTEIFDIVEAHLVNKTSIEKQILRKIPKRGENSVYDSSSSENKTDDNSECISDLVTLTAIIELYHSLIDAIAQKIQTLDDNSYKIFYPEKNSNYSKDDLMRVLFEMRKKAELLNASINSWFKRKLVKNEYEELQHQLKSKVDGHFPVWIIENEMPKHRGIVARMEDGLRKIRNQIYQPSWEVSKNKKKIGKQGSNRYRYFYSTPRIKRIHKHKPRIFYVVDEPSRPAYYYQKRLKRGFWNN
uniref:Uncharacterized protein n=1 Tax=Meloidogyne incognita TaxID=6306 RepID=A0A914KR90_MELIC